MRTTFKRYKPLGGPSDPRHGTTTGYSYWGCRCQPCRKSNSDAVKAKKGADKVKTHGRVGYDYGCRCVECRSGKRTAQQAIAAARKQWREMHASGTPKKLSLRDLA